MLMNLTDIIQNEGNKAQKKNTNCMTPLYDILARKHKSVVI